MGPRVSGKLVMGKRVLSIKLAGGLLFLLSSRLTAVQLKLGKGSTQAGDVAQIPLTLSGPDPVEGFVAVFAWEGTGSSSSSLPAVRRIPSPSWDRGRKSASQSLVVPGPPRADPLADRAKRSLRDYERRARGSRSVTSAKRSEIE